MGVWDNLLNRLVSPIIEDKVKARVSEQLSVSASQNILKGLAMANSTPISGMGYGSKDSRLIPRGVPVQTLRDFAKFYPILRSCINYRKSQMTSLSWDISPVEVVKQDEKEKMKGGINAVKDFLKYPMGDNNTSFREFIDRIMEDLYVLDTVAIYKRRNRGGGLFGYLPVDAATIELVLNDDGTTPLPPDPAYVQKINGMVHTDLSLDEMIYKMANPRTNSPYGLSLVETLIVTVTTALKLSSYNLSYLTEGNIPEGFVELPKDIASDPDQLKAWQEAWDSLFSGNPKFQRKIKFLPEGMKYTATKKQEEMQFERFEKWLLLNTCSVMAVPPQAIGFQFDRGKGATEAEWEIGKERGAIPTAAFFKEIFDKIIQQDLKHPELQLVWTNLNPTNKKEEADVFKALVGTGAVSVDEWRIAEGYDPIGLGQYIMTPVGPVMAKDFVEMSEKGTNPFIPKPGTNPNGKNGTPENTVPEQKKQPEQKTKVAGLNLDQPEVVEELKKWKRASINDLKNGRDYRDFTTDIVDMRTQSIIKAGLASAKDKESVDQLFDPFITHENKVIKAMVDLYEDIVRVSTNENPEG
ncbi:MAG: hypothetical protein KCHDKBKB_00769 [Elusimicrobia bacterium]|nr:hypothetical protein [Elusimicrobiota bacterium]